MAGLISLDILSHLFSPPHRPPLSYPLHRPAPISSIFSPSLLSPTPWRSGWWIEPMCRKLTAKVVWVMSSFIVCIAMAKVTILSSCRSR